MPNSLLKYPSEVWIIFLAQSRRRTIGVVVKHVSLSRRRSRVRISYGPPNLITSVSVPCYHHRIGPDATLGPIAQLVEHGTENAGVGGSTPPWATNLKKKRFGAFFRWPKPCSNLPPPGIFSHTATWDPLRPQIASFNFLGHNAKFFFINRVEVQFNAILRP